MIPKKNASGRSIARLYAVLAMYQYHHDDKPIQGVVDEFLQDIATKSYKIPDVSMENIDVSFFQKIITKTVETKQLIDDNISRHLTENWTFERLDPVILEILRLGSSELINFKDVPTKVIFNEYMEVAKSFFDKKEASFVNGILHNLAQDIRSDQE